MKKILASVFALSVLAGCTYYDYYKGGVRYTQDGDDCIYYAAEDGRYFDETVGRFDRDKKVVYRNTRCADLYVRDTNRAGVTPRIERAVLTSAPATAYPVVQTQSCGCATCAAQSRSYVFVPAI